MKFSPNKVQTKIDFFIYFSFGGNWFLDDNRYGTLFSQTMFNASIAQNNNFCCNLNGNKSRLIEI